MVFARYHIAPANDVDAIGPALCNLFHGIPAIVEGPEDARCGPYRFLRVNSACDHGLNISHPWRFAIGQAFTSAHSGWRWNATAT